MIDWGRSLDDWYVQCDASMQRSIARRKARLERNRNIVAGFVLLVAFVLVAIRW